MIKAFPVTFPPCDLLCRLMSWWLVSFSGKLPGAPASGKIYSEANAVQRLLRREGCTGPWFLAVAPWCIAPARGDIVPIKLVTLQFRDFLTFSTNHFYCPSRTQDILSFTFLFGYPWPCCSVRMGRKIRWHSVQGIASTEVSKNGTPILTNVASGDSEFVSNNRLLAICLYLSDSPSLIFRFIYNLFCFFFPLSTLPVVCLHVIFKEHPTTWNRKNTRIRHIAANTCTFHIVYLL